jgi:hypothetical protein
MAENAESTPPHGTPPATGNEGGPGAQPQTHQGNAAGPANGPAAPSSDPTEALKRELETYRLPAGLREQILAELPPPEEHERLYRELREKGGLAFQDFFEALLEEVRAQS